MVVSLQRGANGLHIVQLMQLPPIISCFIKIQNGLSFCCRLTQVVLEKRPSTGYSSSSNHNVISTLPQFEKRRQLSYPQGAESQVLAVTSQPHQYKLPRCNGQYVLQCDLLTSCRATMMTVHTIITPSMFRMFLKKIPTLSH